MFHKLIRNLTPLKKIKLMVFRNERELTRRVKKILKGGA